MIITGDLLKKYCQKHVSFRSEVVKKEVLHIPDYLTGSFSYVDCGARGDTSKKLIDVFSNVRYIGFEPDRAECERLAKGAQKGHSFYPVAIGRKAENARLYVTRNPACSSLYVPNRNFFDPFIECGPFFDILSKQQIQVVALDTYLPRQEIKDIDFLELDTQGAELDILLGAEEYIRNALGVKVEVEFAEMYKSQPMFADIDAYLRRRGFTLFDLERYHLRRNSCPPDIQSREQIVWGQALYLRDYHNLYGDPITRKQKLGKLAMIASWYGFHSYAMEIVEFLLKQDLGLLQQEKKDIEFAYSRYVNSLKNGWLVNLMLFSNRSFLKKKFHKLGSFFLQMGASYLFATKRQKYFWVD